jgi:tyrosine-protein phosphatase SIW14
MRRLHFAPCMLLLACTTATSTPRVRPAQWAEPVIDGEVENWYRVSPDLHRCAQPTQKGLQELAHFGIQSIVNLRKYHSDQTAIAGTSLSLIEVPVGAGNLTYDQLVAALKAVAAAAKPTCVHCWHGSDRTGAVIAAWRIAVEGWTPAEALDEMVAGGYGHSVWFTNLRELIGGLDADRLRADAGIAPR